VALDENDLKRAGRFNPDAMSDTVPMVVESSARKSAEAMAKADDPKSLPGDVTAETAMLSALLWCGSFAPETLTVGHVLDLLETPEPFKVAAHRTIFGAMLALYADRRPVDAASVQTEIVKRREDRQTGGADYLERLVSEATPTSEPALRGYAQAIRDAWVRRKIIEAAEALARDARSAPGTGTDMLEKAVTSLTELAGKSSTNAATVRFLSCAKKVMRDVISNNAACIPTGFRGLDDLLTGFFSRETTVLAARTSVGKSALATHFAFNTTEQDENAAVLYISLEMPSESFVKRMLASRAGVPLKKLRRQCVDDRDMQRMVGIVAEFQTSEVHFIESQIQTMMSIHTTAQRLQRSLVLSGKRLSMIIIDHLGLVRPAAGSEKKLREQQVAEISRGMRVLAEKHNCHVMGLAQISREAEKQNGGDTTPRIHHMRESGALEQDPDNVLILHRQRDKGGKFIDGDPAKLFVAKARNDELGMIELDVDMSCMKFTERFS
jgi:replicative DNA helicase